MPCSLAQRGIGPSPWSHRGGGEREVTESSVKFTSPRRAPHPRSHLPVSAARCQWAHTRQPGKSPGPPTRGGGWLGAPRAWHQQPPSGGRDRRKGLCLPRPSPDSPEAPLCSRAATPLSVHPEAALKSSNALSDCSVSLLPLIYTSGSNPAPREVKTVPEGVWVLSSSGAPSSPAARLAGDVST